MHGVARQALEWVRLSEQRVAAAEARTEKVRDELKQRALETVQGFSEEGRRRIARGVGAMIPRTPKPEAKPG